ncbi:MAG: hypothetical protein LKI39_15090 [Bacteroides sp.]|jgi:hypothetical protein|nr:hypothetical protein [Bacteroides sp.]
MTEKRFYLVLFMAFASVMDAVSQNAGKDSLTSKEYPFLLMDSSTRLFTMRQSDENSLSLYRLSIRQLNKIVIFKNKPLYFNNLLLQSIVSLVFIPLTHEEGHRSILTHKGIGSISQPFFNKDGAAYVRGVRDADLKMLRDTDLPTYIRLHTAGLESDYAMLLREASLMNWRQENKNILWTEYFLRKISLVTYYSSGLLKVNAGIKEENDELKRDIVGHDVYGAIRHLYRPDMEFKRYTDYKDLTREEKKFVKRVGWRSLLNLADPLLIGKTGFKLTNKCKGNFALGYGMVPFGDYIDEHFWLLTQSINAHFYLRQYENKNTWFPAFGTDFYNISITKGISVDAALHGWMQPKALAFKENSGKLGGAIDVMGKYRLFSRTKGFKELSLNLGITAKTEGFLLEEMNMGKHLGLRLGTSIWL